MPDTPKRDALAARVSAAAAAFERSRAAYRTAQRTFVAPGYTYGRRPDHVKHDLFRAMRRDERALDAARAALELYDKPPQSSPESMPGAEANAELEVKAEETGRQRERRIWNLPAAGYCELTCSDEDEDEPILVTPVTPSMSCSLARRVGGLEFDGASAVTVKAEAVHDMVTKGVASITEVGRKRGAQIPDNDGPTEKRAKRGADKTVLTTAAAKSEVQSPKATLYAGKDSQSRQGPEVLVKGEGSRTQPELKDSRSSEKWSSAVQYATGPSRKSAEKVDVKPAQRIKHKQNTKRKEQAVAAWRPKTARDASAPWRAYNLRNKGDGFASATPGERRTVTPQPGGDTPDRASSEEDNA